MLQNRRGSDNEWTVNSEPVRQATEVSAVKSGVEQHECAECSAPFYPTRKITARNPARFCSKVCACRAAGRRGGAAFHRIYRQDGVHNFNFKGWRSRDRYAYSKRYRETSPAKEKARSAVAAAVRRGHLIRPDFCESCLTRCDVQAHHDDYAKHLVVDWLCLACHRIADSMRRQREELSSVNRNAPCPCANCRAQAASSST